MRKLLFTIIGLLSLVACRTNNSNKASVSDIPVFEKMVDRYNWR